MAATVDLADLVGKDPKLEALSKELEEIRDELKKIDDRVETLSERRARIWLELSNVLVPDGSGQARKISQVSMGRPAGVTAVAVSWWLHELRTGSRANKRTRKGARRGMSGR